jgi:REP element-mobilizing transposase RayT
LKGAAYVITSVAAARRPVFATRHAAECVIAELVFAEQHALAVSLAWAVMPDHLHWMFVLRTPSLSRLVERVKSRSARHINALDSTMGMIWQPGFYDHQV